MNRAPFDPVAVEQALNGAWLQLSVADREQEVTVAHERKWSGPVTAARLHVHTETVMRIRRRLGLEAWPWADQVKTGRNT